MNAVTRAWSPQGEKPSPPLLETFTFSSADHRKVHLMSHVAGDGLFTHKHLLVRRIDASDLAATPAGARRLRTE